MFKRTAVVLVPFPFTDLSAQKVRPAVIISDTKYSKYNVIVAFISSTSKGNKATGVEIKSNHAYFEETGLKKSSVVKCNKIATLNKKIILGELGYLPKQIQKKVDTKLKKIIGI